MVKMMKKTLDGETRRIREEIVRTTHPHFSCYFAEVCVFVAFTVVHVARVWVYFHPRPLGMLTAIEEQDESVESSECKVRVQRVRYHKPCHIFGSCFTRLDQALDLI